MGDSSPTGVDPKSQRDVVRQLTHINLARGFRGGERQTELLVRALAERGVPQRLVVRRGQPLQTRLANVDRVQVLPIGKPFTAHFNVFRGGFLHAHDGRGAHVAHWMHTALGLRYVITRRVDNRPSGNWATRRMYRRAAGVAVLSAAIESTMQDYLPGLSTVCIPSASSNLAANTEHAAELRRRWGGRYVVGQVGALTDSHKGQRDLIQAARVLLNEDGEWRFVLVGGGNDEAMLREAARGMENQVILAGHVDNVGDYLTAFDVMAHPSVHEGLGSTLLDAMSLGLPIVASNVDGIPEIVTHEQQGLLTPPRDPVALAAALRRLRQNPAFAEQMGAAGHARATDYKPDVMADRYMAWYRSLGLDCANGTTCVEAASRSRR